MAFIEIFINLSLDYFNEFSCVCKQFGSVNLSYFISVSSQSRTDDFVQSTMDYHAQDHQGHHPAHFGDYNRRMKGWQGGSQPSTSQTKSSHLHEQHRYKGPENYFPLPGCDL